MYLLQGKCSCCGQLKQEYSLLLREKEECRRVLEDLMRENELKSRECHEAQASLHELRMELMRKSMHVGSLGKNSKFVWLIYSSFPMVVGVMED
jgi:kinesin family protein C2/C3